MSRDSNDEVAMTIDSIEVFRDFVQTVSEKYRSLARQAPSPKWAESIKRLARDTSEVLMNASPLLQQTALFSDLKLTHERLLKLISENIAMIDSENRTGSLFTR